MLMVSASILFFEGSVDGFILEQEVGSNGFGYDPHFYLPSRKELFSNFQNRNSYCLIEERLWKMHCFLTKNQYRGGVEPTEVALTRT